MDIQRFNAIVRQLGFAATRRRLLGLAGGSALGGGIVPRLPAQTSARKRKKKNKQTCPTRNTCPRLACCQCSGSICQVFEDQGVVDTLSRCRDLCASLGETFEITMNPGVDSVPLCSSDAKCIMMACPLP